MPEPSVVHDQLITGPAGHANRLQINPDDPMSALTVTHWLLTTPGQTPLVEQYFLAVVRLEEHEGFDPPLLQFAGATHELLEVALDPEYGPYTPEILKARYESGGPEEGRVPALWVNIALQYQATDEEMTQLAKMAAWGVTNGMLAAEPPFSRSTNQQRWAQVLLETLEHIRGGHS